MKSSEAAPLEVGKRPKATASSLPNWPPKRIPDCAVCLGRLTIVWGEKLGSELFMCYPCSAIHSIDWVEGKRTRQAEVDSLLKTKPGLVDRLQGIETEDTMASTNAKKSSAKVVKVKAPKGKKLIGRTTGKGIAETWVIAFSRATTQKWTDDAISRFMKSEFPGRTSSIFELKGVKAVRSRYNSGILVGQTGKPATRNVAVDKDGKPMPRAKKVKAPAPAKAKRVVVVKK